MTKLSELRTICAEREAALSDEERAERDKRHKETLRDLARQHEVFSPINAMERALAPMRAMEEMLAPMRGVQEMLSLAENPALRLAQETMDNSAVRLAREIVDSPTLRLAREAASRLPDVDLSGLDISGLASLNHLPGLTRDLERVTTPPLPTMEQML